MANMKTMVFYPFNVLFFLGEAKSWNVLLFLQVFLSMIFSYILSRDFKLSNISSMFVSLGFALSSLMVGVLEFGSEGHVLLWLPLFFLFAKRYMEREKRKYLILLGFTLAFSIFAGQLQYIAYMLILLAGFILFYGYILKVKFSVYFLLFLAVFLGIGMSALQLLPSIELFPYSHRGLLDSHQLRDVFTRGLINPSQIFRLLSPDFFGNPVTRDLTIGYIETSGYFGIIPLFFCVFAMIFVRNNVFVRFFTASFIVALLLSSRGVGEILYFLKIPIVTSGSADRIFLVVLFSGAILSGFGLDKFVNTKNLKRNIFSLIIFTLTFIVIIGIYLLSKLNDLESAKLFLNNIKFVSGILAIFFIGTVTYILLFSKRKNFFIAGVFTIFTLSFTFFDLFRLGYRFLTFSNEKFFYPEMGVTRFIKTAQSNSLERTYGITDPELGTFLNIYTVETYNPLYLARTGIALQALQGKLDEKLSIDNKYFLNSEGEKLKRVLDFLGVSFFVLKTTPETKDSPSIRYLKTNRFEGDFKLIYRDDRHAVYKNLTAYPRFGLYYQAQEVKDDAESLQTISQNAIDFRKKVLLEEKIPIPLEEGSGSAKLLGTTVNTQKFRIETDKPSFFYVSDTFFPGWKAKVNNHETKIYRANYNFRAVLVPKGNSIIEFMYIPNTFLIGVWISALSLLFLIFLGRFHFPKISK